MFRKIFVVVLTAFIFSACSAPAIITAWKLPNGAAHRYQTILVVAAVSEDSPFVRAQVEDYLSAELKLSGYNALTAIATYGPRGLAGLPREETLLKLCNNGIDAVLTVALIDGSKDAFNNPPKAGEFPANYYLDRIWNYKAIEADWSHQSDAGAAANFWEVVLFDLYTLQPHCALQTRSYNPGNLGIVNAELAKAIVTKLMHEKVLRKNPVDTRQIVFTRSVQ